MGKEKFTKTYVKTLGFTDKLIRELLPEPEYETNPIFRCAAPMQLFDKADVERAMESPEFKEYQEKAEKRRLSAKKAVETKKRQLADVIDECIENTSVEIYPYEKVIRAALRDKAEYEYYMGSDGSWVYSADAETVYRFTNNFIRHLLTDYETQLRKLNGKVGKGQEYQRYRVAVDNKIREAYPMLQKYCTEYTEETGKERCI